MKGLFITSLILIVVSLGIVVFVPKKERIDPIEKINALKNLSELATAEYHVTKIVKFSDEKFYGDRKILFETSAILKAGVELNGLKDSDFILKDDTISLFIPQPKLLSLNMQSDSIKEMYIKTGLLRKSFSNKDKDKILAAGEKSIRDNINNIGIIESARKNTRTFLVTWLRLAGFKYINVYFREKEIKDKEGIVL